MSRRVRVCGQDGFDLEGVWVREGRFGFWHPKDVVRMERVDDGHSRRVCDHNVTTRALATREVTSRQEFFQVFNFLLDVALRGGTF